jgi:hypothetical protein
MGFGLKVAVEFGLVVEVEVAVRTLELVRVGRLVMRLGRTMRVKVLLRIGLMLTGGAMKAFQFLDPSLLPTLLPKAIILDPMLAGLPCGLERCPARASLVWREPTFASRGGEVVGDGEDPVPREAEATEGTETRGETFDVVDDVGDEEDAPVNVNLGIHANP